MPRGGAALDASLLEDVRALALDKVGKVGESGGGSRVEVTLSQPRSAPAPRALPDHRALPAARRAPLGQERGSACAARSGRTPWNVYLPITVKVFGRALVVPAGAAAGSVLADADLAEAEVDLAEEFTPAFVDRKLAVGRTLAQALQPGPGACARPSSRRASGSPPARRSRSSPPATASRSKATARR